MRDQPSHPKKFNHRSLRCTPASARLAKPSFSSSLTGDVPAALRRVCGDSQESLKSWRVTPVPHGGTVGEIMILHPWVKYLVLDWLARILVSERVWCQTDWHQQAHMLGGEIKLLFRVVTEHAGKCMQAYVFMQYSLRCYTNIKAIIHMSSATCAHTPWRKTPTYIQPFFHLAIPIIDTHPERMKRRKISAASMIVVRGILGEPHLDRGV